MHPCQASPLNWKGSPMLNRTYATDGKCHNSNAGTFGHECGRPATWLGQKPNGYQSGFCDQCKEHGDERHAFTSWIKLGTAPAIKLSA